MPYTPGVFIPPLPGENPSPNPSHHPPLVPSPSGPLPSWLPSYQTPGMQHAGLPVFAPPGSYFPPPVGLPPSGVADDWVGFGPPGGMGHLGGMVPPPSGYMPHLGLPPGTPWYAPPQLAPAYPSYPVGYPPHVMYPQLATPGPGFIPPTPAANVIPVSDSIVIDPSTGQPQLVRPKKDDGFLDTKFRVGKNYGPVLDPIHTSIIGCSPKINPLLRPPPDNPAERPHLEWNMLFSSAFARRSSDPSHISFSKGRDEPATFPRVTSIRLLSHTFPWVIDIHAGNPEIGVTCGDVVDQLSNFLLSRIGQGDFDAAPRRTQSKISETYHLNRSRAHGVPGGRMGEGLMRADWLGVETMFEGIEKDADYVRSRLSLQSRKELPCIWVLRCARRTAMTEDEMRELDIRAERLSLSEGIQ